MKTVILLSKKKAVINEPINVTCTSHGFPEPIYTIHHNGMVVSADKRYTISKVKWKDAGTYKCIAKNALGVDSDSDNLNVTEGSQQFSH